MSSDFVHLHNHSEFSLLDGACKIKQMIEQAVEFEMPALALTDHGALFGVIDFYLAAKEANIQPIIGCESYICKDRFEKKNLSPVKGERGEYAHHLLLLAKNETGYKNLVKISSTGYTEGFYYRPRIDHNYLIHHTDGLIATSGCMASEIPNLLMKDDEAGAWELAKWYKDLFKEDFYIEIQRHNMPEEIKLNARLIALAKKLGCKIVATNDTHYLKREHAEAHDALLCIGTAKNVSDTERLKFPCDEFYFKSPDEMKKLFHDLPEVLLNTREVAEKCNLQLDLSTRYLPKFPLPQNETSEVEYLAKLARAGLTKKYHTIAPQIQERLDYELNMIERMGFAGYFLITADFIQHARSIGVPVGPGRGSAAGSLVCYVLGITSLDPLRYDLYFERFLNPERISMPDIDIDFADEGREKVIEYVKNRYGDESVTQIITFGRMKARAVVRDVGRVFGVPYAEVDRLAKKIPEMLGVSLDKASELATDIQPMLAEKPVYHKIWEISKILENTNRHASTHAAGVVITPGPLTDYVPLYRQSDSSITTQFDMNVVDRIGLLKMDFLGLRTLRVLAHALSLLEKRGIDVDLEKILDEHDDKTYELLGKGNTIGVFQLESSGMREWLTKLKPSSLDDIIAMVALYRPGPMDMIGDFIRRKHGQAEISYLHPLLEPILKPTYGVIVYQEQVLRITRDLAGFSLGKADILRRAMGKKKKKEMEEMRIEFIDGCLNHAKINKKLAGQIFDLLEKFSNYGFVKAHAACYGVLAYQTAYLKANFPAEFMAAELSSWHGETRIMPKLINDCRACGLPIRPPDVNFSDILFTVEGNSVRCGLESIKNVGGGAITAILDARARDGKFRSFYDFAKRVDMKLINRKVLESLIGAGALDSLGGHRTQFMAGIDMFFVYAAKSTAQDLNQSSLFGEIVDQNEGYDDPPLPEIPPQKLDQQLIIEKELLGYYASGHPLDEIRDRIDKITSVRLGEPSDLTDGSVVRIAGIITAVRRMTTRRGAIMASITVEDFTGSGEILVFADVLEKNLKLVQKDSKLVISAKVSCREEEDPKFIATELYTIEDALVEFAQSIWLSLGESADTETLNALEDIFLKHSGNVPVYFKVTKDGEEKIIQSRRYRLRTSAEVLREVANMLGQDQVKVGWN